MDVALFLRRFVSVSDEELRGLTAFVRPVRYEAGTAIFRAGEVCRDVVLVGDGLLRAYYLHEAREVNLRLLTAPAAAVALSSLITGLPAGETLEAVTAVEGYRARLKDYEEAHPGALNEKIHRVLAEQHYLSMERRLRMLQWKSAEERYAFFLEHMEPALVKGMPGYHVASYLGIAPESLSRVKARRA